MRPDAIVEQLYAIVILGWSLLRSIFSGARGVAVFREHYAPDRLPPVAESERRRLPTFGGCIACGLCDVGQSDLTQASNGAYAGVMDLMLASSRSMPDYDAATASFAAIGDAKLAELEKICPARVPMREIAAFVRAKGEEIRR
jgi:succinate dehydrogenase/fumarate reductase-like Fe-S protein